MAKYSTISEFSRIHPYQDEAIQFVCISPSGEIDQWIVSIEDYHNEVKNIMTQYGFVNGWFVHMQTIKHFR